MVGTGSEGETKDSARERFYDAVMKQEQQEIENALLAENQPADESAGDTYHDHHQDERLRSSFFRAHLLRVHLQSQGRLIASSGRRGEGRHED